MCCTVFVLFVPDVVSRPEEPNHSGAQAVAYPAGPQSARSSGTPLHLAAPPRAKSLSFSHVPLCPAIQDEKAAPSKCGCHEVVQFFAECWCRISNKSTSFIESTCFVFASSESTTSCVKHVSCPGRYDTTHARCQGVCVAT